MLIILWVLLLIASLWDVRAYTNRITQIIVFLSSVAVLYTSFKTLRKLRQINNPFIICYALGWLPICLTSVYVVLALVEVIPFQDNTLAYLTAAGILEATLISLALLGDRVRLLSRGKQRAELRTMKLIQDRNAFLEQKIEERTKELQLVNDELQASNDSKDKLFSIITHDMRSPLASLKAVLQLADSKMIDAARLEGFLGNIRKNTEQVQKMMDNLLHWSISQMGLQRYHPEVLKLHAFIHEHMALYEVLAANKQIQTRASCPEDIAVYADKNQLSLIVRNLIDNAIKFTPPEGFLEVSVHVEAGQALFKVANSGEPLSDEQIDRILSENKNSLKPSYGTAAERGAGLGLQLCKEFIRNLNSSLNIQCMESADGSKVIFWFEIPLHEASRNRAEA